MGTDLVSELTRAAFKLQSNYSDYFARIDFGRKWWGQLRALCYPCGGKSQSGPPVGSPSNWRCVALEKPSRVK
jgi:hypothetical protein